MPIDPRSPQPLVLSLFPGIGMLDHAFEMEGFCVVRGPDLLWGGDIRRFNPPAGRFDGVIGGPPCKAHSPLANIVRAVHGEGAVAPDLIPEFNRCVAECGPTWFVMENVPRAPLPSVSGYRVRDLLLNNRQLGEVQNRVRRFSFGTRDGRALVLNLTASEAPRFEPTVTANSGGRRAKAVLDDNGRVRGGQGDSDHHRLRTRSIAEIAELQGLPRDFLDRAPFTAKGKKEVFANGVPIAMGRAVAEAVRRVF